MAVAREAEEMVAVEKEGAKVEVLKGARRGEGGTEAGAMVVKMRAGAAMGLGGGRIFQALCLYIKQVCSYVAEEREHRANVSSLTSPSLTHSSAPSHEHSQIYSTSVQNWRTSEAGA